MNHKIKIKETKNADTRNTNSIPTKEVLLSESKDHIKAVSDVMDFIAQLISLSGKNHDVTKIKYIDEFYENFVEVMKDNKIEFKELGWWKKHLTERHHLNDRVPDDVNLIDVIEMVVDCVCAGMARSGNVNDIVIPTFVIEMAILNTQKMLVDLIEVEKNK